MLLADEQVSSVGSAGNVLWPLADHLGTIRDIADYDEGDPDFEITNHRVYDSFGRMESETNSAVDLSFGFTGKYTDEDTGYTHHLHRWYDPATGRWLSEDPIGFAAGDTNLSRYVGNDPVHYVDPTGLLGVGYSGPQSDSPAPQDDDTRKQREAVLENVVGSEEGKKALRNVFVSNAEVRVSEYVRSYKSTRNPETGEWSDWEPFEWGAMTERKEDGSIIIHIPKDHPPVVLSFFFVHEATHAIGGDEEAAYEAETRFALEVPAARELARPGFIIPDPKGNDTIDRDAIKKFVDDNYGGWFTPDPNVRWKTTPDGRGRVVEYGTETTIIWPWQK